MFSRLPPASMDPVWSVLFVSSPISGASFYKRRKVPKRLLYARDCVFYGQCEWQIRSRVSRTPCVGREGTIHRLLIKNVNMNFLFVGGMTDCSCLLCVWSATAP